MYELTVISKNKAIAASDILGRAFDVVIAFEDAESGKHRRSDQHELWGMKRTACPLQDVRSSRMSRPCRREPRRLTPSARTSP
jgi:hypothetical protein